MNTHNIGFYKDLTNIIFELSTNMHLISSAVSKQLSHVMFKELLLFLGRLKCLITGTQCIC